MSQTAALVLALILLVPHVSLAQTANEEAVAAPDGRAAFAEGVAAFDAGQLEVALERFERALELTQRQVIRFNIATCHQRLGRQRAALLEFEQLAAMEALPEETRAQARERAAAARSELGALSVTGGPEGADVSVDDAAMCVIPCRVDLDPGLHAVRVEAADHVSHRVDVQVARAELRELTVELAPVPPEPAASPAASPPGSSGRSDAIGALGWTGVVLAALGAGGVVGFGLRGLDLEAQYDAMPSGELREEGIAMQVAANASIGLASLGALLFVIDLAVE